MKKEFRGGREKFSVDDKVVIAIFTFQSINIMFNFCHNAYKYIS